jgi:hypothetical protein
MTKGRIENLRVLLKAHPVGVQTRNVVGKTPIDMAIDNQYGPLVLRLLLRYDPDQNLTLHRELNWQARKEAVWIYWNIVKNWTYYSELIANDDVKKSKAVVILGRLVLKFGNNWSFQISSGVMRHIVSFL